MDRRTFLTTAATSLTIGVSGCTDSNPSESRSATQPSMSKGKLAGWQQFRQREINVTEKGTTAVGNTIYYEDTELRRSLAEETLGVVNRPVKLFYAAKIQLNGWTSALAGSKRLADNAENELRTSLKQEGITRIQRTRLSSERSQPNVGGSQSVFREFAGVFSVKAISLPVTLPNGDKTNIKFDRIEVPVRIFMAVWKEGLSTGFISGGVFPGSDISGRTRNSITGTKQDGIDVIVEVNLDFQPQKNRQEIIDLIESVR